MLSVTDDENPDIQGSYAPNTHTGRYILILQAGHSYRMVVSANGYPSEKITFTVDKPIKKEVISLDTIILDSPDTSFFINFATNSLAISEKAKSTLKETYKYFENHRDLDVNIFASINPISDYNKKRKAILQRLLTGLGIPKKQIFIDAKESKPIKVIILDNDYTITEEQNTVKDEGIVLTTIYFGFNKWTTSYYNNYLNKLAVYMKKNPETLILVKGYTDNVGNNKYNNRLSLKRAKFVKNYLVEQGVNPMQIRVKGFGKSNFIASNASEEGSSYNRRVEIKVIKSGTTPIKIEEPNIPAEYKIKK
jgi:outer membrane protein OmpA-like peptidoglycan-associated protein